ncbi:uncharacterized protein [Cherax quadricarinatus]|uniref:uncharacterized protein n=1 Tax=Cherax quadricarinatus TaxID=27406 RepID=UPI002378123D|nr:uncharacterized protein LOC128697846 [Cherax quadricarinatus]
MFSFSVIISVLCITSCQAFFIPFLEKSTTRSLQEWLKQHHPFVLEDITDFSFMTDFSSVKFNADNLFVTGFDKASVTKFVPPLPFFSDAMKVEGSVHKVFFHSNEYYIIGSYRGSNTLATGAADVIINNLKIKLVFQVEKFNLLSLSLCIRPNTLSIILQVDSILCQLEGAEHINTDVAANGPYFMKLLEKELNDNSIMIEEIINQITCSP